MHFWSELSQQRFIDQILHLYSISELLNRLADETQVGVERGCAGSHLLHLVACAVELNIEVCGPVIEHVDVHISCNCRLLVLSVHVRWLYSNCFHCSFCILFTGERDLDQTVLKSWVRSKAKTYYSNDSSADCCPTFCSVMSTLAEADYSSTSIIFNF